MAIIGLSFRGHIPESGSSGIAVMLMLLTSQVLHRSEVQEWQVRLEEAQEKARTLDTLNVGLRQERDSFRKVRHLDDMRSYCF